MIYKNAWLHNVVEMVKPPQGEGEFVCRIPESLRARLNGSVQGQAYFPAGCEIRFNLKGPAAKVKLAASSGFGPVDVLAGCFNQRPRVMVWDHPTEIEVKLPDHLPLLQRIAAEQGHAFDPRLCRIALPHDVQLRLLDIEGEIEPPQPSQVPSRRMLAYGSSITQGYSCSHPTGTYILRTGHLLGVDVLNIGYGGGAHLEAEMAQYLAQRQDWDFAVLELGINLVVRTDVDTFAQRVKAFLDAFAAARREKWIFCIDLFPFRMDYEGDAKVMAFRRIVRDAVAALNLPKLVHIDGREILTRVTGLSADICHPIDSGFEEMAQNLSAIIARTLRS
jgi:hypothetical protein